MLVRPVHRQHYYPRTAARNGEDHPVRLRYHRHLPKCMARIPGDDQCNRLIEGSDPAMLDPKPSGLLGVRPTPAMASRYSGSLTDQEKNGPPMPAAVPTPSIRLMGQDQAQRSGLTVNNATYYIDTTLNAAGQKSPPNTTTSNVFEKNHTYYTYLLFAKPTTKQTYQLYVG